VLFERMVSLSPVDMVRPPLAGTRSPVDIWKATDAHAGRLRAQLGLNPVAYAGLAKDLGLAAKASDDALERLAAQGAEIATRRAIGTGPAEG
jgi:hypothetical protein